MSDAFIRSVVLRPDGVRSFGTYPFSIPAIRELSELALDKHVTFLVGENGCGKSTLVEAIAVAAGFNPEGGSRNMIVATRSSHSVLWEHLRLVRGVRRPRTGYFLRSESFFNVATYIEQIPEALAAHGGKSLHEQSHGESFLSLAMHRFGPNGLYILDEPEAALSVGGELALVRRIHDLVAQGCQFVIATHSPILLGFPEATIYALGDDGIKLSTYEATEPVTLTWAFLDDRDAFLRHLLA